MTMINAISKKQEGEPMGVHLRSGTLVYGNFKKVEDGLLKMTGTYVISHDYQYSSPRVTLVIDAVEMCLPGEKELAFQPS